MSKLATKLVWSITPFGVEKQGLQSVVDILNKNQISVIRATYSKYSEDIIQKLKSLLHTNKSDPNTHLDPTFLFEFVGRRCFICVPNVINNTSPIDQTENEKFVFHENHIIDVKFNVDFEFCAKNKIANSESSYVEMKVSSADQLKRLKVSSVLNISYGAMQLKIKEIVKRTRTDLFLKCKVIQGGAIFSGAKVHSSDISRDLFPLLPGDKYSLKKKFHHQADYLFVSGLKSERELLQLKTAILGKSLKASKRHPTVPVTTNVLKLNGVLPPRFLLKIGSKRSFNLMPKILSHADGILLNRSQLCLNGNANEIGILQKKIIDICNKKAKAIVILSELMQSMSHNPTPTRAEVSDMANAMGDGADALVISSEVTHGPYNMVAAQVSCEVLKEAQALKAKKWKIFETLESISDDDVVTYGAMRIAKRADVSAIVCFTKAGYTAYRLSALRTQKKIIAITCNKRIFRQLNLLHSVQPIILDKKLEIEKSIPYIKKILVQNLNFKTGDKFVFVALAATSVSPYNSNFFTLQCC